MSEKMEFNHLTVLLNETVNYLNIDKNGIYVDCTLGGGGHSGLILERLSEQGKLIGIDQDEDAITAASAALSKHKNKTVFIHNNFSNLKAALNELGITAVNGIIADLGVSSHQLDTPERGFSFMVDSPLDMRMNRQDKLSAYLVVNTYSKEQLTDIIYAYGEEKWAKRIAEFIIAARQNEPIRTTFDLVSIIKSAVPKGARQEGKHPATRTFQAIRIEVNGELRILKEAIHDFFDVLAPGGRICIISFHSLEDRVVKTAFSELASGCKCPPEFPVCVCGIAPRAKLITRKPISPSDNELETNPRSRSAKLRCIEKLERGV